jgi:hypothetical protein
MKNKYLKWGLVPLAAVGAMFVAVEVGSAPEPTAVNNPARDLVRSAPADAVEAAANGISEQEYLRAADQHVSCLEKAGFNVERVVDDQGIIQISAFAQPDTPVEVSDEAFDECGASWNVINAARNAQIAPSASDRATAARELEACLAAAGREGASGPKVAVSDAKAACEAAYSAKAWVPIPGLQAELDAALKGE